jgi:hypothetical protein
MALFWIATLTTLAILCVAWLVDQQVLGCKGQARLWISLAILGIGLWEGIFIGYTSYAHIPESYNSVPYWVYNEDLDAFIMLRNWAGIILCLILVFGPVPGLAIAIAFARILWLDPPEIRLRKALLPALAFLALGAALFLAYVNVRIFEVG